MLINQYCIVYDDAIDRDAEIREIDSYEVVLRVEIKKEVKA